METQYYTEEVNIENQIERYCALIDSVIKVIKKPRRIQIIKVLYEAKNPITATEIQEKTGIPQGSAYKNLEKLYMCEILSKTDEKPAKYFLTNFAKELLGLNKEE